VTAAPGAPLTAGMRAHAIAAVLEARFSLSVFEASRRADAAAWDAPRNDMARGIYGQALREKARLDAAADSVLVAEARDLGLTW